MPGLFWKPHSAQTLPAALRAGSAAACAAAKAVPHARQNLASSLFSVLHTEQSLLMRPASRASSDLERRYLALCTVAIWPDPRAMDNAATSSAPKEIRRALCDPQGASPSRRRRLGRRHGLHAVLPASGG